LLDFLHNLVLGGAIERLGGQPALEFFDALGELFWVVVDRVHLLPQFVALLHQVSNLALYAFNVGEYLVLLVRVNLQLFELSAQFFLNRVSRLLPVDHVALLLLQ